LLDGICIRNNRAPCTTAETEVNGPVRFRKPPMPIPSQPNSLSNGACRAGGENDHSTCGVSECLSVGLSSGSVPFTRSLLSGLTLRMPLASDLTASAASHDLAGPACASNDWCVCNARTVDCGHTRLKRPESSELIESCFEVTGRSTCSGMALAAAMDSVARDSDGPNDYADQQAREHIATPDVPKHPVSCPCLSFRGDSLTASAAPSPVFMRTDKCTASNGAPITHHLMAVESSTSCMHQSM